MLSTSLLIHTDVINIQRLDVVQQLVILDFRNHAEGMSQHFSVIIHEDRLAVIIKQVFKFPFIILCSIGFEQVWAYHIMHHVNLVQQLNDSRYVSFLCFPNHSILYVPITMFGIISYGCRS